MTIKLISWDLFGEWMRFVAVLPDADGADVFPKINIRKRDVVTYTSGQLVTSTPSTSHPFIDLKLGGYKATIRTRTDKWEFEFTEKQYFFEFTQALDEWLQT